MHAKCIPSVSIVVKITVTSFIRTRGIIIEILFLEFLNKSRILFLESLLIKILI